MKMPREHNSMLYVGFMIVLVFILTLPLIIYYKVMDKSADS